MVEWENTSIGELLAFKNGLNKSKEFFGQGTPIVNYMDVYKNRGIHAEQLLGRVTLSAEEIKRFDVLKGDVFFTRTSETPEEVGYSSVMLDDVADCVFSGFVLRGRPITDKLDALYCQYAFMNETIRKAIISSCTYTTRALTNGNLLSAIEIQLPEKTEQRRIAEVLSDTDDLIATLEKQIAKKRAIKQGTMQELLTRKRRLPGFSGEWVEKKVSDFGIVVTGATPSTSVTEYWNGNIPWVTPTDISVAKDIFITERMITECGLSVIRELPANTLLITCIASIGKNTILRVVGASNQQINAIIPNANYDVDFLYYLFELNKTYLLGKAGQTATSIISKQDFLELLFTVPCSLSEQTAIASILSDMDAEINVLTVKLNKLRNIKQGMMSELLTGHIRLVEQKTEIASDVNTTTKIVKLPKKTPKTVAAQIGGHNQQFDDAVMIAGIVNALYSDKYPLGRKKVQKSLYLLRRHQDESTAAFKKKAAGPYADEVRYKGGEPIAVRNGYIKTQRGNQGTKFTVGEKVSQALGYIESWGKQADIQWVADKLKYKNIDKLELLATVDMAICDLTETGTPVSVDTIKNLIATNAEWKAKLKKQTFNDDNIANAIQELQILLQGENRL